MKKILFAASECVPFIKTGGLADVCGALPKEFSKDEWDVRVVLPNYSCIPEHCGQLHPEQICRYIKIRAGWNYILLH